MVYTRGLLLQRKCRHKDSVSFLQVKGESSSFYILGPWPNNQLNLAFNRTSFHRYTTLKIHTDQKMWFKRKERKKRKKRRKGKEGEVSWGKEREGKGKGKGKERERKGREGKRGRGKKENQKKERRGEEKSRKGREREERGGEETKVKKCF